MKRDMNNKMIGGVCAGLANAMGVDPAIVRIGFVLSFFFGFSLSFWVYLILWIVMPKE